jgi:AraC family transcriptional regulator of adaptative response/methylated-DNA-[protein]-cysteine methyltransferase
VYSKRSSGKIIRELRAIEHSSISGDRITKARFVDKLLTVPPADIDMQKSVFGRKPVTICYGVVPGWFGDSLIATSEHGVCWLDLHPIDSAVQELRISFPAAKIQRGDKEMRRIGERVFGNADEAIAIHLSGTDFQLQVWQALLRIPAGACMSYGQLARCIGAPTAARATGHAIGGNKVAVLVPCHRVLPADGKIGNFRWGPERKKALLLREHAVALKRFPDVA